MSLLEDHAHRVLRLFTIINALETGQNATRAGLAEKCHCSERTIRRDLALLRAAGVCYSYDYRERGYRLDEPLPFVSLQLSLSESLALALACDAFADQPHLPFASCVRQAFRRLQSRLPTALQEELQATRALLSLRSAAHRDYSATHWRELLQTAIENQTVRMLYHTKSRDEITLRDVDPYGLVERDGYLVLVGYCHLRRRVLLFGLDSIRALTLTGRAFEKRPDFTIDDYLCNTVGLLRGEPTSIVVRFKPEVAVWARERVWPFAHELIEAPDGSVLLRGTVSGLEGIKNELLRWGAKAVVLEPPQLRCLMFTEAQAMIANYDQSRGEDSQV